MNGHSGWFYKLLTMGIGTEKTKAQSRFNLLWFLLSSYFAILEGCCFTQEKMLFVKWFHRPMKLQYLNLNLAQSSLPFILYFTTSPPCTLILWNSDLLLSHARCVQDGCYQKELSAAWEWWLWKAHSMHVWGSFPQDFRVLPRDGTPTQVSGSVGSAQGWASTLKAAY